MAVLWGGCLWQPEALLPGSCWQLVGSIPCFPMGQKCSCSISACCRRGLCSISVLLLGIRAGTASFQVPPSPPGFRESGTFCCACLWLRAAKQGVVPAVPAAPWGSWMPRLLLCLAGLPQPSAQCLVAQWAGHLQDAAVGHRRAGKGLKVPTSQS